jgi:hypothetical protein
MQVRVHIKARKKETRRRKNKLLRFDLWSCLSYLAILSLCSVHTVWLLSITKTDIKNPQMLQLISGERNGLFFLSFHSIKSASVYRVFFVELWYVELRSFTQKPTWLSNTTNIIILLLYSCVLNANATLIIGTDCVKKTAVKRCTIRLIVKSLFWTMTFCCIRCMITRV